MPQLQWISKCSSIQKDILGTKNYISIISRKHTDAEGRNFLDSYNHPGDTIVSSQSVSVTILKLFSIFCLRRRDMLPLSSL